MVKVKHLEFETEFPKIYFFNITQDIKDFIAESGIKNGTVTVQSEHTTCAVFFEEWVHDEDRKGHDRRYAIDFSKIKDNLGFCPTSNFDTSLKMTLDWYLNNKDWLEKIESGEYQNAYKA